ncbi:hypothetical protein [Frigidibacter sp. ROC022]|nr:hypothetical protein [Frigidibacter sp. ROC022]MCR8724121.1 hypothetical protein [Frigidibacter sp. ROC022]
MTELTRVLRSLRRAADDPRAAFAHQLRIGLSVAALILLLSLLG